MELLKKLVILLLFLMPSSLASQKYDIGIIYILPSGSYTYISRLVDVPCETWWRNNLVIIEIPNPKPMQNHYIHLIENKPVIGYICNS